ncbi:MAG: hypothetical protein Q4G33_04695 [bacterium]|nr:hypothetical protein [bacterium]
MKKILSTLLAASMIAGSFAGTAVFAENGAELQAAEERTPAFPGAEGGGMYTKGARAAETQEIYHVTNLNDSGEGSFRDAVSKPGRFVVFDVSGMIDLLSNVSVHSNTTILGQTAPGDGICIRGNNVKLSGNDIIVRYIRFRVGAHLADGSDTRAQDGLEVTDNSQRIIIDHCSVSWGTDENLSAYAVKDVTIQNSIIAEALNQSVHDKGEHSYAAIWGGVNLTVHHNIIASHKSRNPKIGTSETVAMTQGYTDAETVVDIRNNIFYNWGDKAGYGAENGANVNIINNYYKPGPATPANKRARIFEFSAGNKYEPGWSGAVYADGNYIDDEGEDAALVNENNWQPERGTGVYADGKVLKYVKLEEPNSTYIDDYPINTVTAQEAYDYVLENAGARLPKLDVVDARIIENVKNGTAPDGSSGSAGLVDDPRDTVTEGGSFDERGYPVWETETRNSDYDTDGDGIPNEWEISAGLNPDNPHDSLNKAYDGYTWLEVYANGASPEFGDFSVNVNGTEAVFDVQWAISSGAPTLYIDGVSYGEVREPQFKVTLPGGYHTAMLYFRGRISAVKPVPISDGENALADGQKNGRMPEGDYKLVSGIEPSNLTKGIPSYIYAGDYAVGCGYDDNYNKKIYFGLVGAMEESDLNADEYTMFKIEYTDGFVSLYAGKNLAQWEQLESHPADLAETGCAVGTGEQDTVTVFTDTAYVTEETNPSVKINNHSDGDRIGYNETLDLTLIPDNADISQVIVYFNDEIIASQNVSGTSAQIPISFSNIASGTLKVECIDNNLCIGSESIDIYVSADLTPWKIAEIGNVNTKTFVSVTPDYTYKINAPEGYIGGDGDECGYVYQEFDGDARIYYRSRMQSASQFGIMLRSSLEADADMYWFGGEYNAVGTEKLTYDLKHRGGGYTYENGVVRAAVPDGTLAVAAAYDERGALSEVKTAEFSGGRAEVGEVPGAKVFAVKSLESLEPVALAGDTSAVIDYTLDNQQPNLYFIAEKAGNTLNIYQTENSATVYKTKTLLASIDCSSLGDRYYMGFAAAGGGANPPDAGWVAIDNNSGDSGYVWNFNNGLDWLWQMQERNVLSPSWTNERISNDDKMLGKMKITVDDEYTSERYIFREYQMSDALMPEMHMSFCMTGETPAMNIYFQTGEAGKAYKAEISEEMVKVNGNESAAIENGNFYIINIRTDMTADGERGYFTLMTNSGDKMVDDFPMEQVTGTEFREQINTEKKTPVTNAVYIEPKAGSEGTYYIDNVIIKGNEPSVKVTKTESWYSFAGLTDGTFAAPITINGVTRADGTEESGTTMTVSAGEIKDSSKSKSIEGVSFKGKCRIKGTGKKLTVPVTKGAVVSVYAASASSSSERVLRIDGNPYPLLAAAKSDYIYEGDGSSIEIYAEDNIDVYGVSVIATAIE